MLRSDEQAFNRWSFGAVLLASGDVFAGSW